MSGRLSFSDFQRLATPIVDSTDNPLFAFVGLGGEVGEFLNVRKKIERDGSNENLRENLLEEAGDILFYLRLALEKEELTMEDAAVYVLEKLRRQKVDQLSPGQRRQCERGACLHVGDEPCAAEDPDV